MNHPLRLAVVIMTSTALLLTACGAPQSTSAPATPPVVTVAATDTAVPPTSAPIPPTDTSVPATKTALPPTGTPKPTVAPDYPPAAELVERAKAAEKQARSMRVSSVQETESAGQSFVITCDGVVESPARSSMTCDYGGTRAEVVLQSETEGFARRAGAELWLKTPKENLAGALEPTLDAFTGDMKVVDQESIEGADSYVVEASVDLGKMLRSNLQLLQSVDLAESGGTAKAWIGKDDFLPRRYEIDMTLKGAGFEVQSRATVNQSAFNEPVTIPKPEPYASQLTMATDDPVFQVAFSPDGRMLAACDDDAFIYLWSTLDPEVGGRFIDHPELSSGPEGKPPSFQAADFYSLAFAPDSQVLAAGSLGEVLLYKIADLAAKPVSLSVEQGGHIQAVAYSPDGHYLAGGGDTNLIYVWNMQDAKAAPTVLKGHEAPIRDLLFLPGGGTLVSASEDKTIRLWDVKELKAPPKVLSGHEMPVYDMGVSADGKTLLSVGYKDPVYAWSMEKPDARPDLLIKAEDPAIAKYPTLALALSPDGRLLATADLFDEVRLWAAPEFDRPYAVFATGNQYDIMTLAFSPDGRYLAAGQGSDMVHIWDLKPEMPRQGVEPVATVTAGALTVQEILARNTEAMAALHSMQVTMTVGSSDPAVTQAMTVTAGLQLPGAMHGRLDTSGKTQDFVKFADGRVVVRAKPGDAWKERIPGIGLSPDHDFTSLSRPEGLARSARLVGTESVTGDEAYLIEFLVSPRDFFGLEPMLAERLLTPRVQVTGRAWIGRDDFLTRRVVYEIALKTPWVDTKAEYGLDVGGFNEPVDIPYSG